MKVAYLILAHHLPDQLQRLIDRLNVADASFWLHIGRAKPDIYSEMLERLGAYENIHFLARRRIRWGTFVYTQVVLDAFRALLASGAEFDYVANLSGQDYPIKTNSFIFQSLAASDGKSFVDHFPIPSFGKQNEGLDWTHHRGGLDRIELWHVHRLRRNFRFPNRFIPWLPRRSFPAEFRPYGGQGFWFLSREAVESIDRLVQTQPGFVGFFRYADCPDELFIHTILMNSPLSGRIVNDDLRYIVWDEGESGPRVLGMSDLLALRKASDLFARKFDARVDAAVLDAIDEEILGSAAPSSGATPR